MYNTYEKLHVSLFLIKLNNIINQHIYNEDTKEILDGITLCKTKITELKNRIKKETNFSYQHRN